MKFNQNRLRFVHCEHLFENVEEIKNYVSTHQSQRPSLYAEPQIFKYGDEEDPKLVLAIGSVGEGTFKFDAANGVILNKTYFIDFSKAEEDIKTLFEEVDATKEDLAHVHEILSNITDACGFTENGEYVQDITDSILKNASNLAEADKMLSEYILEVEKKNTLHVEDTNSLSLNVSVGEDGTLLKGDVKRGTMIKDYHVISNIIIEQEDGIFTNVDVDYVEDDSKLVLTINGSDKKDIVLPREIHPIKGEYKTKDESLHLTLNKPLDANNESTNEILIDLSKLIEEWVVLGEASTTPIVLTKEHVGSITLEHASLEEWQDILSADVRIADPNSAEYETNILKKTSDGKALWVDGRAENILYVKNGNKMNVKEALDAAYSKVSNANGNIITLRDSGLFSYVDVSYDGGSNALIFKYSQGEEIVTTSYTLNQVKFFENASYNNVTNTITISYVDASGVGQSFDIPINEIFKDFTVNNDFKTITLEVSRDEHGTTVMSGNVNVASDSPNNILQVVGNHDLYVEGVASNIAMSNITLGETVEESIVALNTKVEHADLLEKEARMSQDTLLAKAISDEEHRATDKEDDLSRDIQAEESRAKLAEKNIQDALDGEITRAQNFDEVLEGKLNAEINRATDKENAINQSILDEVARSKAEELSIRQLLGEKYQENKDAIHAVDDALTLHKQSNITDIAKLNDDISNEHDRATTAEGLLSDELNQEKVIRQTKDDDLQNQITTNKKDLSFSLVDTDTIDLSRIDDETGSNGFAVKADVKVSGNIENIIKTNANDGIFASVDIAYDTTKNSIKLITSNKEKEIQLNSSAIQSITFDRDSKELVFEYKNDEGQIVYTGVSVNNLFNQWDVNHSEEGAIRLSKTSNTGVDHDVDSLWAEIVISTLPGNIIKNDNGLYVSNDAKTIIARDGSSVDQHIIDLQIRDDQINANLESTKHALGESIASSQTADNLLQTAIDAEAERSQNQEDVIEKYVGLNEDGTYFYKLGSHYINDTESVMDAVQTLDESLFVEKSALDAKIYTEKSDLEGKIEEETSNRIAQDAVLDARIDTEKLALESKLENEESDRKAKDIELQNEVDSIEEAVGLNLDGTYKNDVDGVYIATATSITHSVTILDRLTKNISDDVVILQDTSDSHTTTLNTLVSGLNQEIQDRKDAVSLVSTALETEKQARISEDAVLNAQINAESANRIAKDNELSGVLETFKYNIESALATEVDNRKEAVEHEASDRANADTLLDNRVTNLATDLGVERDRAVAAETRLDDKITALTANVTSVNDTLTQKIVDEAAGRVSADTALETKINEEIQRATVAETALQNSIDTINASLPTINDNIEAISAISHANILNVLDTDSVALKKDKLADGIYQLTATAQISDNAHNALTVVGDENHKGLMAKVLMSYDTITNKLTLEAGNETTEIQLNSVSTIKRIYYNQIDKKIYMVYDVNGIEQETSFLASDLFKAVLAKNGDPYNIITEVATNAETGGYDISAKLDFATNIDNTDASVKLSATPENKLKAEVNISTIEDNLLQVDADKSLYVIIDATTLKVIVPIVDDPTNESETNLQSALGYIFGEIFKFRDFIEGSEGMVQQILQDINNLKEKTATVAIDTPSLDLTYTATENSSTIKGYVVLSKDSHNLLDVYDDTLVHPTDGFGNITDNSTNGLIFDGSIDYRTYLDDKQDKGGWTRYLQIKRNDETNLFTNFQDAYDFLTNQAFLSDKKDGEPILARYTDVDNVKKVLLGFVYEANGLKNVQILNQKGTMIDKIEYVPYKQNRTYTSANGHVETVSVDAESIYFQYTDGSGKGHHLIIPLKDLIEEYKYISSGLDSDDVDLTSQHNVNFKVVRKQGTTNSNWQSDVYGDIDYYDCGEY